MDSTAITTLPFSFSKPCDTSRPRIWQAAATRTGLGRKRFIHFFIPCAIRNRLVRKHLFEGMPARVQDAFSHAGFGEFRGRHIADHDVIKVTHDLRGSLVQKVCAAVRNLGVDFGNLPLLSGTLRDSKALFEFPIVARMLDFLPVGQRSEVSKTKINADTANRLSFRNVRDFDNDVQKPVAAPILAEAGSVLDLAFRQGAGIEHAECVAGEPEGVALALQVASLERHPAKRALAAIAKERAVELLARLGVLLAHRVDGSGVQSKLLAAACCELVQVEPSGPSLAPFERVFLRIVAEIKDVGNRPRLLVQQAVQRLHTVAVNLRAHWCFRYSSIARRMCSATESPVFSDRALSAAKTGSGRNMCVRFMHILYLSFQTAVQPVGCAPFLPGLNAGVSRSK